MTYQFDSSGRPLNRAARRARKYKRGELKARGIKSVELVAHIAVDVPVDPRNDKHDSEARVVYMPKEQL